MGSLENVSSGAVSETGTEREREIDQRGKSGKLHFGRRGSTRFIVTCAGRLLVLVEAEDVPVRLCGGAFLDVAGLDVR